MFERSKKNSNGRQCKLTIRAASEILKSTCLALGKKYIYFFYLACYTVYDMNICRVLAVIFVMGTESL